MALFRYPNSQVWWYEFRFNRQRIRESSKSRSKTLAAAAERARRRQLEETFNGIVAKQLPPLFSAAAEEFLARKTDKVSALSLKRLRTVLKRMVAEFGQKLVTEISAEDLKDYRRRRLMEGVQPRTANIDIEPVRAIFIRYKCWEAIRQDFSMLPVAETIGIALSRREEHLLLKACKESRSISLYYAVLLALCTGMRYSEIRFLRWCHVDQKGRFIIVGRSKTEHGRGRRIPMNRRLAGALSDWAKRFPDRETTHYVFPRERYGSVGHRFSEWVAKAYGTDPTRPFGCWKTAWNTAKKAAGVECRFHDLRHTACTRMLEGGTHFSTLAALMGWSPATTVAMAKRYGHLERSFAKAVAAMDDPPGRHRSGKTNKGTSRSKA